MVKPIRWLKSADNESIVSGFMGLCTQAGFQAKHGKDPTRGPTETKQCFIRLRVADQLRRLR